MRRPVVIALVGVVVTALLVLGGLALVGRHDSDAGSTAAAPSSSTPFTTTPLTAYDTAAASVPRGAFCDRVDPRQVSAALGGAPTSQRSWSDGDRARLGGGPTDVSHEFGCEYVGGAGTTARAWVFVPPVRSSAARRLAARTDGTGSCTSTDSTFGAPSSLLACEAGQQRSATYRGLFGDAWLTCELTAPVATAAAELADRAGRWCVGVVEAVATGA